MLKEPEMNHNYFAVIMAGGIGSRFWPVSTPDNPKQFHDMLGTGKSLIQHTFQRLAKIIPKENILISTNQRYKTIVLDHLKDVGENQLVLEPAMRNTAPCILYSALKIRKINPNAVMIVAPSDHFIEDEEEFVNCIETAFKACEKRDILMTLGVRPSGPNTGYGYIKSETSDSKIKKVQKFAEKPDLETAKRFLKEGDYLWNAGIFVWTVQSIIKAFEIQLPNMVSVFKPGETFWNTDDESRFIDDHYEECDNISIDYGVMEGADNVYTLPVDFGWNDLGTWGSLYEKLPKDTSGNAIVNANTIFINSNRNLIRTTKGKKVVIQGLSDFMIIETTDTLMIIPQSKEQQIKQISKEAEKEFNKN